MTIFSKTSAKLLRNRGFHIDYLDYAHPQCGLASYTGRPITGNDLLRIVKRRLKATGLPEGTFSCHSFRATTATDLLRNDVPREQVQFPFGLVPLATTFRLLA